MPIATIIPGTVTTATSSPLSVGPSSADSRNELRNASPNSATWVVMTPATRLAKTPIGLPGRISASDPVGMVSGWLVIGRRLYPSLPGAAAAAADLIEAGAKTHPRPSDSRTVPALASQVDPGRQANARALA